MDIARETKWLCENARGLERFSGRLVTFSVKEGVVTAKRAQKFRPGERPFVLHVPSKKELDSPFPVIRKQ